MSNRVAAPPRSILARLRLRERIRDRDTAIYGILLLIALVFPAIALYTSDGSTYLIALAGHAGTYVLLAIGTLGFGEIVPQVFQNFDQWTGGINAIGGIDQPTLPAWVTGPWAGADSISIVAPFSFSFDPIAYYVLIFILVSVAIVLVNNLHRSRLGRAWMAIREDEVAAAAMGINTVTTKLLAFAIGASFSGFAGA